MARLGLGSGLASGIVGRRGTPRWISPLPSFRWISPLASVAAGLRAHRFRPGRPGLAGLISGNKQPTAAPPAARACRARWPGEGGYPAEPGALLSPPRPCPACPCPARASARPADGGGSAGDPPPARPAEGGGPNRRRGLRPAAASAASAAAAAAPAPPPSSPPSSSSSSSSSLLPATTAGGRGMPSGELAARGILSGELAGSATTTWLGLG